MTNRQRGFTLLELMIVCAVIALLAAVALPSYRDSVIKSKRAQGRAALVSLLQQEERYLTQRNCYLAFSTDASGVAHPSTSCGVNPASVPMKAYSGENADHSAYLLSAVACPDPAGGPAFPLTDCVQVVATPKFDDPAGGALTMTSTGRKECTGTDRANSRVCWPS
jgi:type IV pilus assembly protein PilE